MQSLCSCLAFLHHLPFSTGISSVGRKISGFRLRVNVEVIQYVVLGPRLKVVNLNILPESLRYELKYALKIPFKFLSIILKFQVPDINILLEFEKRRPFSMVLGPQMWSLDRVSGKQHEKNVKMS